MDVFPYLVLLVLLPVVLLMVFLGCGLSTTGTTTAPEPPFNTPATLHILDIPNIGENVKTLKVFFKAEVVGIDGEVTRETEHTRAHKDIDPDTFVNDFNLVSLYESGKVSCRCAFFMESSGLINADEIDHEKVEHEPLPEFKLARDENDNPIVT